MVKDYLPHRFSELSLTRLGTLLIPIWLLLTPGHVRLGRILLFLLTVMSAYFFIGLALLLGTSILVDSFSNLQDTSTFLIGQFTVGTGLVIVSQLMDSKSVRAQATERAASGESRALRWRARAMGDSASTAGSKATLLALAITAVIA